MDPITLTTLISTGVGTLLLAVYHFAVARKAASSSTSTPTTNPAPGTPANPLPVPTTPATPTTPTSPAAPHATTVSWTAKVAGIVQSFNPAMADQALQSFERLMSPLLPAQVTAVLNEVDQLLKLASPSSTPAATSTPAKS